MSLLIGVDAGASHTAVAVADGSLERVTRGRGGPGAVTAQNTARVARHIAKLAGRALKDSGRVAPGAALVVGAAGAGHEATRAALEAGLLASGIASRVRVTTDAAIALHSAFGDDAGVVLQVGTGSIAVGRDARGVTHRVGGWGWQFGDEGSGYALGRGAVATVTRAADGRGPSSRLTAALLEARGVTTVEELLAWARHAAPSEIAELASTVCHAASHDRDPVATVLVEAAAVELARHVDALLTRLAAPSIPVALAGGLLHAGSPVRTALVGLLAKRHPPVRLSEVTVDPARGALALAARLLEAAS